MAQIKKILFYINGASGVEAGLDRVAAMPRRSEAALPLLRGTHHSARAEVEELVRRVDLGGVEYAVHLRKGEPMKLVPELAGRVLQFPGSDAEPGRLK